MAQSLEIRFWAKVKRTPNCWLWCGATNNHGYGMIRPGGIAEKQLAHRISYEMHIGDIPKGMDLMHACDTPACVNPAHLTPGTRMQNLNDSLTRGRHPAAPAHPGHAQWKKNVRASRQCLLAGKETEICAKRAAGRSINSLAKEYGVDWSVANRITKGICTHR